MQKTYTYKQIILAQLLDWTINDYVLYDGHL